MLNLIIDLKGCPVEGDKDIVSYYLITRGEEINFFHGIQSWMSYAVSEEEDSRRINPGKRQTV